MVSAMLSRRRFLQSSVLASPLLLGACGDDDKPIATIDHSLPVGPYSASSTAEEVTEGLDLTGTTALVTGCNSGLGYETLRVLALRGAHVIGTARTMEKAQTACDSVDGNTTPVVLELSDHPSILDCAATVQALGTGLDILVCNAGIMAPSELELVGELEKSFAINYLGHFLLVNQLLPMLLESPSGRIVHTSSAAAYSAATEGIDFNNLRGEKPYQSMYTYGVSKLAVALFSLELARRLEGTNITSNTLHPGFVSTNIMRSWSPLLRKSANLFARTPAEGAATQVYVATNPGLAGVNGAYFEDCNPVTLSGKHHMFDETMARRLWLEGEKMLGDSLSPWKGLSS